MVMRRNKMAGIKHPFHNGVPQPLNGKDIWARHEQLVTNLNTVKAYCKLCGNEILPVNSNELNHHHDWEQEMEAGAHMVCIEKYMGAQRNGTYRR